MSKNISMQKRLRQNKKAALRNKVLKARFKTSIKKLAYSIENNLLEEATTRMKLVCSFLDKAVKRSVIHKNFAARQKSKWTLKLNELKKTVNTA